MRKIVGIVSPSQVDIRQDTAIEHGTEHSTSPPASWCRAGFLTGFSLYVAQAYACVRHHATHFLGPSFLLLGRFRRVPARRERSASARPARAPQSSGTTRTYSG